MAPKGLSMLGTSPIFLILLVFSPTTAGYCDEGPSRSLLIDHPDQLQTGLNNDQWPDCKKCNDTVDDIGAACDTIVAVVRMSTNDFCKKMPDPSACLSLREGALGIVTDLRGDLFPSQYQHTGGADTRFACSHAIRTCPDYTSEGQVIANGGFSCGSCRTVLNSLLKTVGQRFKNFDTRLVRFFCQSQNPKCVTSFTGAIRLGGAIEELFLEKKTVDDICKNVISCLE